MIRSGNPALKGDVFGLPGSGAYRSGGRVPAIGEQSDAMTIQGTANKSLILLALVLLTAFFTWRLFFAGNMALVTPLMWTGVIGGFILAIVTIMKKTMAPVTAPLYAAFEGLALGGISAIFETRFPGIVVQAVGLTFAVLFSLLFAYKSRIIRATENFKLGVTAATGGIALLYLVQFGMSFFGAQIPYIHESGMIGIGFSLFVCVVAAANLVMDFDFIESGEANGAPKYMEWYGAFGLLVTLVWLYLEILRLLSKLQSRR